MVSRNLNLWESWNNESFQQALQPRSSRHHPVPFDNRPITGKGAYNLNFIDWDNEYEAVIDHMSNLIESGNVYEERPYHGVSIDHVRSFLTESYEFEEGNGLTLSEISSLREVQGKDSECSICLDHSSVGLILPCGHIFHKDCITKWLRCRIHCPNCRGSVRQS